MRRVSGTELQQTYLDVSIEAQRRHEDTLDIFKCWRPLLLPIYVKGQVVLVQIQKNTNGGTFGNSSFSPKVQRDHTGGKSSMLHHRCSFRDKGNGRAEQHSEMIIPAAFGNDLIHPFI